MSLYSQNFIRMFLNKAEAAKKLYSVYSDAYYLKKEAISLTDVAVAGISSSFNRDDYERFRVSKANLEKCLEINPEDHQAKWHLGKIHYLLVAWKHSMNVPYETVRNHADIAIQCLTQAQIEAPDLYGDRTYLKKTLEDLNIWLHKSSISKYPKTDDESEKAAVKALLHACQEAKIENARNPDNSDNLTSWGASLIKLYLYADDRNGEVELLHDAIKKLKKALSINPYDTTAENKLSQTSNLLARCWPVHLDDDDKLAEESTQA